VEYHRIDTCTFLFNIHINDLEEVMCTLLKSADNTDLEGPVNTLKGRAVFQRDLGGLEEWADRSCVKFCQDKCKILSWEERSPCSDTS